MGHEKHSCVVSLIQLKIQSCRSRSLCAVVAKWTYTKDGGFDKDLYTKIGLEDLCQNNFEKIGE